MGLILRAKFNVRVIDSGNPIQDLHDLLGQDLATIIDGLKMPSPVSETARDGLRIARIAEEAWRILIKHPTHVNLIDERAVKNSVEVVAALGMVDTLVLEKKSGQIEYARQEAANLYIKAGGLLADAGYGDAAARLNRLADTVRQKNYDAFYTAALPHA